MGKKSLKNRTQFTSTLRNELLEELRNVSKETGVPISKLLDMSVENILKQYGKNRDV